MLTDSRQILGKAMLQLRARSQFCLARADRIPSEMAHKYVKPQPQTTHQEIKLTTSLGSQLSKQLAPAVRGHGLSDCWTVALQSSPISIACTALSTKPKRISDSKLTWAA